MGTRRFFESVGSTQDEALALARSGIEEGTRVVAARQWGGRGRLDRLWVSPPGGVYLSMIVREPPHRPALAPLAVGERLGAALRATYAVPCRLKWPNDLLVPGPDGTSRKIAGILVDRVPSPMIGIALVIGVGVNVRTAYQDVPPALRGRIATVSEFLDPVPSLDSVEALVVAAVESAVHDLATAEGAQGVWARCRASLWGFGKTVLVDGVAKGTLVDLAEDGALTVDREGVRTEVRAGDVLIVEGAG